MIEQIQDVICPRCGASGAAVLAAFVVACGGGGNVAPDAAADTGTHDAPTDTSPPPIDAGGTPPIAYEDTSDGIHPFLTFDYNVTDIATAATHAVYVWGAEQGHIPAYRASSNPKIVLSEYIPFTRDPDGTHDLAYWQNLHPDWVLYQCDQTTPAYEFGDSNVSLDISNPAVVDWQLQNYGAPASIAGYDAIAADNYVLTNEFAACGIHQNNQWKALYTGTSDPQYTKDVLAWASAFAQKLHALPKPIGLIPNFSIGGGSPTDPNTLALVAAVDGILDEGGFTKYGSGYAMDQAWKNLEDFTSYVQAQGKGYFSINEFNTTIDQAAIQWTLASYLMSKEQASGIFISGNQQYGSDNWHAEYGAQIGTPCAPMQAAQGMYSREFKHAIAIVNPTASSASFTLPSGSFKDLYGQSVVGTVTMAAHTGMVLVDSGGPRC